MAKVTYLGHEFLAAGMEPEKQKVTVVQEWETPKDVAGSTKLLGTCILLQALHQQLC